jgi:3-oxoacyl-[acyl-carrier protein] reductase
MGESGNRSSSLIRRLIDPKEIGDFVTYVSSPLASAINGAALRVDRGLVRSVF